MFPASAFGRVPLKERMSQELSENGLLDHSARSKRSALIIPILTMREVLYEGIGQDISGAGIKCQHIARGGFGWQRREVCYSADVQDNSAASWMAEEAEVRIWNKRGAFSAGGHIAGAEIGHCIDPGSFCYD